MKIEELEILPDSLQKKAVGLSELGINEFGWFLSDKKEVLDILALKEQAILGGDLYYIKDDALKPAYVNWFCEPETNESKESFIDRSIYYAEKRLNDFEDKLGKDIVFVLVTGVTI